MDLTYEKATDADIEQIFRFSKELIDRYENIQSIDYEKVLAWVRRKIEKNIQDYECVWWNGQKVGYYHFYRDHDRMEIDDLYVFPQYRDRGIGTRIIQKCCSETGLPVFLYVFIKNVRAVSLYQRLGFRIVETIHDSRSIMQKDQP